MRGAAHRAAATWRAPVRPRPTARRRRGQHNTACAYTPSFLAPTTTTSSDFRRHCLWTARPHSSVSSSSSSSAAAAPTTTAASAAEAETADATIDPNWSYDRTTGIVTSQTSPATKYQSVIGLEIHAQLSSPTKLLSDAPTRHHPLYAPKYPLAGGDGSPATTDSPDASNRCKEEIAPPPPGPNTLVSPYDLSHPGALPRLSLSAVRLAAISARTLGCTVNAVSRFERKHYHYADLPAGYQVTQQRWPLGGNGTLRCRRWVEHGTKMSKKGKKKQKGGGGRRNRQQQDGHASEGDDALKPTNDDKFFTVGIDRLQLEVDTGKTTTTTTNSQSYINLNRVNTPLIEVVFRPDIRGAHEATAAVETVQALLRHVGTCDGRMEAGSLRVDLNVSVARVGEGGAGDIPSGGTTKGGTAQEEEDNLFASFLPPSTGQRTEVKNLNSIRQIVKSTEYESIRQSQLTESGTPPGRETRTYDVRNDRTVKIRDKGGAVDYRFMPEPDLPPLVLSEHNLDGRTLEDFLGDAIPELPEEIVDRLQRTVEGGGYGLDEDVALVIASDPGAICLYEEAVRTAIDELTTIVGGEKDGSSDAELAMMGRVPSSVANWLCNDLFALVKESAYAGLGAEGGEGEEEEGSAAASDSLPLNHPISVRYSKVDGKRLGSLVASILDGTVSTTQAKKILTAMYHDEPTLGPREIADSRGWKLVTDPGALRTLCDGVVNDCANATQLGQYREGGRNVRKIRKFFLGKVMAESRGNAHPELVAVALDEVLEEAAPGVEG